MVDRFPLRWVAWAVALGASACTPPGEGVHTPGSPQTVCYGVAPPSGAGAPIADPRFVGTGMIGAEVPHWPMFRPDAARTGRNGVGRATPPTLSWKFATKGEIWSSAAIGIDGAVYVGASFASRSRRKAGSARRLRSSGEGIESSPAIGPSGELVVGSRDGTIYEFR